MDHSKWEKIKYWIIPTKIGNDSSGLSWIKKIVKQVLVVFIRMKMRTSNVCCKLSNRETVIEMVKGTNYTQSF